MGLTREEITKKLDSLTDELEKIDSLNHFASKVYQTDAEFAAVLAGEALEKSRKSGYKKGIAQALLNKGIMLFNSGDYKTMLEYITESESLMRQLPDGEQLGLHRVINCKAICYYYQEKYSQAAGFFKEAARLSRQAGDLARLGNVYNNLSAIYDQLGQQENAVEYAEKAIEVLTNTGDYYSLIMALSNVGIYSNILGDYRRAQESLEEGYKLALEKKIEAGQAMILAAMTDTYRELLEYSKSEEAAKQCIELSVSRKFPREEITALIGLGSLYFKTRRLDLAEEYLLKALERVNKYSIFANEKYLHKQLENVYLKKGDYKKAHFHQGCCFELEKKAFDTSMNDKMKSFESDSLKQANERIKIISTIGREITSSLDMKCVLDLIYEHVNTLMDGAIFGIARINQDKNQIEYDMFVEQGVHLEASYRSLDDQNSLAALAIRKRQDIIINDISKEINDYLPGAPEYAKYLLKGSNDRVPLSVLCCPLISSGEVNGVITVQSYKKNAYTISDLDSLKALSSYVAIALNNARQAGLIRQQNSQLSQANAKLKKDVQLSRQLQLAMIPRVFPVSPMFKIYGYFNFLDEVGGDLYDVYRISPDKTVILILDVVGHGVSAALVTAMAKILFFNKSKEYRSASEIVEAVNRELTPITGDSFTYFSLFYGIINSKEHNLQYVNAAHPEPFLIRECGRVELLGSSALFVGLKDDFCYEQKVIDLEKGDRLVLFTDGFFEIKGKDKKRFGENRLLETLLKNRLLAPCTVLKKLNSELESYQDNRAEESDDDKTMLIVDFF